MNHLDLYIGYVAQFIELSGVITIVVATIISFAKYLFPISGVKPRSYTQLRQDLGKGILLGLEVLVAGDIIATVVTEPTIDRVLALGVIVLIRTLLSFSLQVEIERKLPWTR